MGDYRYPTEHLILLVTVFTIAVLLAISAVPTVCALPLVGLLFMVVSYQLSKSRLRQIVQAGAPISSQYSPELAAIAQACVQKLKPGQVQFYVIQSRQLNAFTFGFSDPKTVVLYSPMLEVMDADELKFVLGHELGHVALGHTWLNTLLGGVAGVPTSFAGALVLTLAFRWWNRACEYSADRAGLLACGSLNKSISALAQLAVGDIRNQAELQRALQVLETQDKPAENILGETLSTHPMVIKRIKELRRWAQSAQYQRLANQRSV